MCFSLTEKGNPYFVRKKDSEAENSEAENSEAENSEAENSEAENSEAENSVHLSEINEPTSTLYGYNPYIQHQNYQGYIQPQYHQHASFPGYIQPQYHQPASFLGYIYPHIQLQDQGWYKPPPLSAREKNCFTPAERDENERSFLEGERSYENEKKNLLRTNGQRKRMPVTQCVNLTDPFVNPQIGPQIMTIDPPRQPRYHSFHSLALSPLANEICRWTLERL